MFLFVLTSVVNSFLSFPSNAVSRQYFINVMLNDQYIGMDVKPYIKNNSVFVSIRFVAEALNAMVEWVQEEQKAVITDEEETKVIELFLNSDRALVNEEEVQLTAPVELSCNRMMVPLRFISENLDCDVIWDDKTYTVILEKEDLAVPASCVAIDHYTVDDILWLARITYVEVKGLSLECHVAVANVVLNRVKSPLFPNTVYDVIFDRKYAVQFPPAHKSSFTTLVPDTESIIAAKMALEGINNIDKCLYFNNVKSTNPKRIFYKKIDSEYFYY